MSGRLDGEVAIVTGSTSGLGRETARLFAAEGAQVVVTGRSAERGQAVVTSIADAGGDATFVAADLGDEDQCRALVDQAVDRYGRLTVLVNNAVAPEAIARDSTVVDIDRETLERMLQVNVVGPALMCRFAIPAMIEAGHGSIVNISATSGGTGTTQHAAYTASKGAIDALGRAICADFGRQGIRCNTMQSGFIIHEGREPTMSEARVAELLDRQIVPRLAVARDMANAILFLASREAEMVTGVTLPVDGGATAVRPKVI